MNRHLSLFALALLAFTVAGCTGQDEQVAPPPTGSTESRVQDIQQKVEASSNMTAEQKAAAAEYMRRGAEGARRTEETARQMGAPPAGK